MSAAEQIGLGAVQWRLANRQRAQLYGWFATLYAQEVSEVTLEGYFGEAYLPLYAGLADLGLEREVARLRKSIDALRATPLARLELAADFAQLFLLDAKTGALPYASAYEGEATGSVLYGAAEERMRAFLAESGLAIQAEFREPADHLAVYLALMAKLAEQDAEQGVDSTEFAAAALGQLSFLRGGVLGWLAAFVQRCQELEPQFDFYPALASLLLGFVREDELFLDDAAVTPER
ncbi:MAG TPA: molecular chaperone TorD [Thauera sp.]|nr:molecular chaperone TorD [Thauera sp.]HRA81269.1 molecular chaperone TorD [Thauera sp.]